MMDTFGLSIPVPSTSASGMVSLPLSSSTAMPLPPPVLHDGINNENVAIAALNNGNQGQSASVHNPPMASLPHLTTIPFYSSTPSTNIPAPPTQLQMTAPSYNYMSHSSHLQSQPQTQSISSMQAPVAVPQHVSIVAPTQLQGLQMQGMHGMQSQSVQYGDLGVGGFGLGMGIGSASYEYQALQPQPESEEAEDPLLKKKLVPMKHNNYYNINPMLASNILNSRYFRGLYEKTKFQQVVDEIYYKVDNVEPFLTQIGNASNTASTAFCLLYKLFTMKLTHKQLYALLNHSDSPYIRCIGLLYLRYTCPPEKLWNYFQEYIDDSEEFSPCFRDKKMLTIGEYVRQLLSDQKYYGTLLPRIPKQIETDIQVELLKKMKELRKHNAEGNDDEVESSSSASENNRQSEVDGSTKVKEKGEFDVGDIVMARYSEDGKWYEAKLECKGIEKNSFLVTYTEYGNQEEVNIRNMKRLDNEDDKQRASNKLKEDKELRERILERKRREATTSDKRDYSKRIVTFKRTISVPLNPKAVSKELNEYDGAVEVNYKNIDDILEKQGRIGEIEKEDDQERERRERKRKRRQEELEQRYGNEANKSKSKHSHHRHDDRERRDRYN